MAAQFTLTNARDARGERLWIARAVHRNSARRQKPFTAINCAALPENLIESELFGHSRGAFTGADRDRPGLIETSDRGTPFLDEIREMPLAAQA